MTFFPAVEAFDLITSEVLEELGQQPETGILNIFIQHTSVGLTINEKPTQPFVRRFSKADLVLFSQAVEAYLKD